MLLLAVTAFTSGQAGEAVGAIGCTLFMVLLSVEFGCWVILVTFEYRSGFGFL